MSAGSGSAAGAPPYPRFVIATLLLVGLLVMGVSPSARANHETAGDDPVLLKPEVWRGWIAAEVSDRLGPNVGQSEYYERLFWADGSSDSLAATTRHSAHHFFETYVDDCGWQQSETDGSSVGAGDTQIAAAKFPEYIFTFEGEGIITNVTNIKPDSFTLTGISKHCSGDTSDTGSGLSSYSEMNRAPIVVDRSDVPVKLSTTYSFNPHGNRYRTQSYVVCLSRSNTDSDGDGLPDDVDLAPLNAAPLEDLGMPGGPPSEPIEPKIDGAPAGERGIPGCPGGPDPDGANDVVERYAPLVVVHEQETHRPMAAEDFIAASRLKWSKVRCPDKDDFEPEDRPPSAFRLGRLGEDYVYVPNDEFCDGKAERPFTSREMTRPYMSICPEDTPVCRSSGIGHKREGFYLDVRDRFEAPLTGSSETEIRNGTVPAYYRYEPGTYIAYWFFSPYSIPGQGAAEFGPPLTPTVRLGVAHDGDWEHVVVRLDPDNEPVSVEYFFHHWSSVIPWGEVETFEDTHPVVYSAQEGHGSYWDANDCDFRVELPRGYFPEELVKGRTWDDCSSLATGTLWRTWQRLQDLETETDWYRFGGAWGDVGGPTIPPSLAADTTGPMGPHPDIDPGRRSDPETVFVEETTLNEVVAGSVVQLVIPPGTFLPSFPVYAALYSQPVLLGNGAADEDGGVDLAFTVPTSVAAGEHTVELTGIGTHGELATHRFRILVAGSSSVYVLGGSAAVNDAVLTDVSAASGVNAQRVAGQDRHATAAEIARAIFPEPVHTVYVATGANFPDALTGAAAAATSASPVLLVSSTGVPDVTAEQLESLQPQRVVVLGGTAVVPDGVMDEIRAITGVVPERVAGVDRYATGAEIVKAAFPDPVATVYVATGANFPDALAGSAAAGRLRAPVLLVSPNGVPVATASELQRLAPSQVKVLGGEMAVSNAVLAEIKKITGVEPERLAGSDRYETAAAIVVDAFPHGWASTFVATGSNFPDALAGSAAAGARGAPVLLVSPDGIPPSIRAQLERVG